MSPQAAGGLFHGGGLVLVGERHGTNEFPQLVSVLVSVAATQGRVTLALELRDDARDPTAAFVQSPGSSSDRDRLLTTPSWRQQDGRASEAMLKLVDDVRSQVHAGLDIRVDVFDASPAGVPFSASYEIERDRLIAARLLGLAKRGTTVALTGNVHAELAARDDAPAGFVPAAALAAQHVNLTTIVGRHAGGTSWGINVVDGQLVTGVHHVQGHHHGDQPFLDVDPVGRVRTGTAYVGTISSSAPAATAI